MHKENEYKADGRLYVKKMKACRARSVSGDTYTIECRIHQRGEQRYIFERGTDFLVLDQWRAADKKIFYLSEDALNPVNAAVEEADELISAIKTPGSGFTRADFADMKTALYYKTAKPFLYIPIYEDYGKTPVCIRFGTECTLSNMLWELRVYLHKNGLYKYCHPNEKQLSEHPLYIAAKSAGDKILTSEMELYSGSASKETREFISELRGFEVLPRAAASLDKEFYVKRESVRTDILEASGYHFLHQPNFSMFGYTRHAVTVNPHGRYVHDCAPRDAQRVSWSEFTEAVNENAGNA